MRKIMAVAVILIIVAIMLLQFGPRNDFLDERPSLEQPEAGTPLVSLNRKVRL